MASILEAWKYREHGILAIPIGEKKQPFVKWRSKNDIPDDWNPFERYGNRFARASGMSAILGPRSGGLYCRDFDDPASYHAWVKVQPELAKLLPTVKTPRGYHVYHWWDGYSKVIPMSDGEYRGDGGLAVLPPSSLEKGCYEWLVPLEWTHPRVDPVVAMLLYDFKARVSHQSKLFEKEMTEMTELPELGGVSRVGTESEKSETPETKENVEVNDLTEGEETMENNENKEKSENNEKTENPPSEKMILQSHPPAAGVLRAAASGRKPQVHSYDDEVAEQFDPANASRQTRVLSKLYAQPPQTLKEAVEPLIPTTTHMNHELMFMMARAVLTVQKYEARQGSVWDEETKEKMLDEAIELWYPRAKPFCRSDLTKMDYRAELGEAALHATATIGENIFKSALEEAGTIGDDAVSKAFSDDPKYAELVRLCRELQRKAGTSPFFVSSIQIGGLYNIDKNRAWLMCRLLINKKVLKLVKSGGMHKANRYRYLPEFVGKPHKITKTEDFDLDDYEELQIHPTEPALDV